VERVVLNALAKDMRLCRLAFAPSAFQLASSSGEADPFLTMLKVERVALNALAKNCGFAV
jgi:hypothetical protein